MTRHPLGYRKVVLLRVFGYGLRLHVWDGPVVEDPHTHRWGFISMPLRGRFLDVRYALTDGWTTEMVAARPDRGAGRRYDHLGWSELSRTVTYVRRPLRPWLCRWGYAHALTPTGPGPHWSLVLHGREQTASSTIWRTP